MKRRFTLQFGRWGIILGIVFAASMLMAITVWAAGGPPFQQDGGQQTAAQKQAKIHQVEAQETAAAKSPHAPKPQANQAKTMPITSCPRGPVTSGISTALETGGFHDHIISNAIVAPNEGAPFSYVVYAGSLWSNLQQGVIIVMRMDYDSCAANAQGLKITYYPTPSQQGAVTLTQLNGVTLTFTTATGTSGRFDVVAGKFV